MRRASLRAPDTGAGRMAQDTSRGGIVTARLAFAAVSSLLALPAGAAPPVVLVNHLGYDPQGPKRAVVQGHRGDVVRSCAVEPLEGGASVPTRAPRSVGPVARWRDWVYWTVDFTDFQHEGTFRLAFATGKGPGGSYHWSVPAPGPEKAPQDRRLGREGRGFAIKTTETKDRPPQPGEPSADDAAYQSSFRAGGGVAIAALARAAAMGAPGERRADYLRTAEDAWAFLAAHNAQLTNDGQENIVDDYCAL